MDYTIAVTKDTTMTKWALLAPGDCFQNRKPIVSNVRFDSCDNWKVLVLSLYDSL
jgi:hypothetical protein